MRHERPIWKAPGTLPFWHSRRTVLLETPIAFAYSVVVRKLGFIAQLDLYSAAMSATARQPTSPIIRIASSTGMMRGPLHPSG